eukprot:1065899-Pyramimonas_sp.AAC.1
MLTLWLFIVSPLRLLCKTFSLFLLPLPLLPLRLAAGVRHLPRVALRVAERTRHPQHPRDVVLELGLDGELLADVGFQLTSETASSAMICWQAAGLASTKSMSEGS